MKRHATDVTSLVFGLLFLSVCGLWFAVESGAMEPDGLRIAGPIALVSIGLVGIGASLVRARRDR
ncbi:hypothetical protein EF847_18770 [Actinobacteria bacterium YIM 96077]|uniref:Uncharacterized protein n=1 Tax=Phytoactinopolyspora halophila TaxID=1981511 RepID=A0A329QG55_9ACTN|nr:hypothetical protein [Phytoactinopolyspora halophila]AYY14432.1 hypothetical protein EF847_18770 [Actinobacteria bacterium YIM 96077]RAW11425.1 hypothetical protein DPM12_16420 [Phytoactinopolyspora halophila]